MEEETKPEILRCPLERVVLKSKLLDMGEPMEILALAMDPPDLNRLEQTVLLLKEVIYFCVQIFLILLAILYFL